MNRADNRFTRPLIGSIILLLLLLGAASNAAAQPKHAKGVNAYPLWVAPYLLTGAAERVAIFEQGQLPYLGHPEFAGRPAGTFTIPLGIGGVPAGPHATHVAGLILAKGTNAAALGIAKAAAADFYVTADGSPAVYIDNVGKRPWTISNHSYGINRGWRYNDKLARWEWLGTLGNSTNTANTVDPFFGYYDIMAKLLDSTLHKKPEQIAVFASGNQRGVGPDGVVTYRAMRASEIASFDQSTSDKPHPKNGDGGFDLLASMGTSKNAIVVGAISSQGILWPQSNTGPTDDGRIKPDVVATGVDLTVCWGTGNKNGYYPDSADGTSFAAPAVSGALLLLKQWWEGNLDIPFLSASARALLIHTAIDRGKTGPDYSYGWGQVDATAAAKLISQSSIDNGFSIRQKTLSEGKSEEFYIKGYANMYLKLTLAWNDPHGTPVALVGGMAPNDNATKMLVNDLDMRIYPVFGTTPSSEIVGRPFVLDRTAPSEQADNGDNAVDNVEQIRFRSTNPYLPIDNFQHIYKVKITHKGAGLTGDKQDYTLMISGAQEYLLPPTGLGVSAGGATEEVKGAVAQSGANSAAVSWNSAPGAEKYDLIYKTIGSNSWTPIYNITSTERLLDNLQAATYQVKVRARRGTKLSAWTNVVEFYGSTPVAPASLWVSWTGSTSATVKWTAVPGATGYRVTYCRYTWNDEPLGGWKSIDVNGTQTTINLLQPDCRYVVYVRSKYSGNLSSAWSDGAQIVTTIGCGDYASDDTYAGARLIRQGDYLSGLICQGEKEDYYRINVPSSSYKNLKAILYAHPEPYRFSLYRKVKGAGGTMSLVTGGETGLGTKILKLNNADVATYDYYVQVWSANQNTDYSNTKVYDVVAWTSTTPYPGAESDQPAPGAKSRGESLPLRLSVSPNPATSSMTLALDGIEGAARVTIYDAAGRAVTTRNEDAAGGSLFLTQNVEELPVGIYIVVVETAAGRWVERMSIAR